MAPPWALDSRLRRLFKRQTHPPVHVGGRIDAERRQDGRGQVDDVQPVGGNTRAVHEEERVGVGVHPGERAPPEELRSPEGTLRVVALGEIEDQVRGALETRPAIDFVAREDAGHRTAVAGPSRTPVLESEEALADAPEEVVIPGISKPRNSRVTI